MTYQLGTVVAASRAFINPLMPATEDRRPAEPLSLDFAQNSAHWGAGNSNPGRHDAIAPNQRPLPKATTGTVADRFGQHHCDQRGFSSRRSARNERRDDACAVIRPFAGTLDGKGGDTEFAVVISSIFALVLVMKFLLRWTSALRQEVCLANDHETLFSRRRLAVASVANGRGGQR